MSDEEFDAEILAVLERTKTRAVSLRLPLELIERAKAVAEEEHVPYQTLMTSPGISPDRPAVLATAR